MKKKTDIAFLGGDRRQYCTASMINKDNFSIGVWGLDSVENSAGHIVMYEECEELISRASCVVLPLPSTMDGVWLNTPLISREGKKKRLTDVLALMRENSVMIGGKIPKEFKALAEEKGICVFDYSESEDFQIQNAYLTAEAALSIAMNQLNRSIADSKFAILGFGRIAKNLAKLLVCFGAEVTVFARKESDLAWADIIGCKTRKIDSSADGCFKGILLGFDVIYNTIPIRLLDEDVLCEIGNTTFIIDLASLPGGVDIRAAKELGSNVLWATSLPGKYAPHSAGRLIADWIEKALDREGTV